MGSLGWALATTGVLSLMLWALSRAVYHLGVVPLGAALARLSRGSRWPYYALLAPGTALHELSHWLACRLMLVTVLDWAAFSPRPDGTLGWVTHEKAGPVRSQLIGLAPLAGGTAALYLAAHFLMPGLLSVATGGSPASTPAESMWAAGRSWLAALLGADYGRWTTWVFLYVAFVIGRGMVPSKPDLRQLIATAVVLSGTAFAVVLVETWLRWGLLEHSFATATAQALTPFVSGLNALLSFALVAVALGAAALLPLGLTLRALAGARSQPSRRRTVKAKSAKRS